MSELRETETVVIVVDPHRPEPDAIRWAADVIRAGGLVAFPTETVYGLGANALDSGAAAGIFRAKGRPVSNPLIIHVADARTARSLASDWPEEAEALARAFWPGPLTIVLPKAARVPDIVTAGGSTAAFRSPAHPVAIALLCESGVPIAAPSANRSSRLSPTRAEHVLRSLRGRIDLLLDGGPTRVGLESTVLDLTARPPRILRPGAITPEEIAALIGEVDSGEKGAADRSDILRSPGMMGRHYAPAVPLVIAGPEARRLIGELVASGVRPGWLRMGTDAQANVPGAIALTLPFDPGPYAAGLYAALHALEEAGADRIVVEEPPDLPAWAAVRDRLSRASAPQAERED